MGNRILEMVHIDEWKCRCNKQANKQTRTHTHTAANKEAVDILRSWPMIQWLKCMRRLQQLTSLASHPEGTPDREGKLASQYAHRRRFVSRPACKRAQVIIGDQPQQQQQQQQQPQHQRIMNCEFLISSQTAGRHFNSHIDNLLNQMNSSSIMRKGMVY